MLANIRKQKGKTITCGTITCSIVEDILVSIVKGSESVSVLKPSDRG